MSRSRLTGQEFASILDAGSTNRFIRGIAPQGIPFGSASTVTAIQFLELLRKRAATPAPFVTDADRYARKSGLIPGMNHFRGPWEFAAWARGILGEDITCENTMILTTIMLAGGYGYDESSIGPIELLLLLAAVAYMAVCAGRIELQESGPIGAEFDAGFSHCKAHCRITRECPGGDEANVLGYAASIAQGVATEVVQSAMSPWSEKARESAFQHTDWYDNQLGREQAEKQGNCHDNCKDAMGGVRHREGPGTNRPYGPFHPEGEFTRPGWGDVFGWTMPAKWGPYASKPK
jgi:hypothetical protein